MICAFAFHIRRIWFFDNVGTMIKQSTVRIRGKRCVSQVQPVELYMRYASLLQWRNRSGRNTLPKKAHIVFFGRYTLFLLAHTSTSTRRTKNLGADSESPENFIDEIRH